MLRSILYFQSSYIEIKDVDGAHSKWPLKAALIIIVITAALVNVFTNFSSTLSDITISLNSRFDVFLEEVNCCNYFT